MIFTNRIISYGISSDKKNKNAVLLNQSTWLESLERCQKSFGLEGVTYEYWSYPTPNPEVSIWIKNNKAIVLLLSDGFLKIATESQVVNLLESLNTQKVQEIRQKNKQEAFQYFFTDFKGGSRRYRYWVLSFFLYPLERFLKIAKI